MDANLSDVDSMQKNLLAFLEHVLTAKHKSFFETFQLLMNLRSKDLSRFFKDAASFKP